MSTTTRCASRLLLALTAAVLCVPSAWAFYPHGFFSTIQNGELIYIKWPLSALDTNGDGDVSQNEGIELNFETGNGSNGFSADEVEKVLDGMSEWERVSTCYVAFRRGQDVIDPVETSAGLGSIDAFNVMIFDEDDSIGGGTGALILPAFTFDDTFVTIGDTTVQVGRGQVIDVDIAYGSICREVEAEQSGFIQGIAVPAAGLLLGLDYSPLAFVTDSATPEGFLVEDRVIAIRNFDNSINERGVTSSMLNEVVVYSDDGSFSWQDLAPTDISAITFMYPRTDLDFFFDINQRARTQARDGFPSQPISGSWIRAWVDADNNEATERVPMADTLTGLYYNTPNSSFTGHFQLKGLFKQLETIDEQTFTANYTVTSSEFLPIIFPDELRTIYDSTHGGFLSGTGQIEFDTLFPAEVFRESGNLLGLGNIEQGTPLVFDVLSRKIVSETSGKTLDVILATGRPMFGEQDQTCPLLVVVGPPVDGGGGDGGDGGDGGKGGEEEEQKKLAALRAFRDDTLLGSGVGVAIADTYYRIAPIVTDFLLSNSVVYAAARWFVAPLSWIISNAEWLLLATGLALLANVRRSVRVRRAVVASAIALGAMAVASHAQMLPYEISDYLVQSDDVIVGTVTEVESRWINNNTNIVSDVAIRVEDPVKGTLNKDVSAHIQLPTGRVGAVGRSSQQLPEFKVGEKVLVFLDAKKQGYMVTGGTAGKYLIVPHPKTGEKYLLSTSLAGHVRLEREIAKMKQESAPDGMKLANTDGPMKIDYEHRTMVKLDDFVKYLRNLDKKQQDHTIAASNDSKP